MMAYATATPPPPPPGDLAFLDSLTIERTNPPSPRKCVHCKETEPDDQFINLKDPSKRVGKCLDCRQR